MSLFEEKKPESIATYMHYIHTLHTCNFSAPTLLLPLRLPLAIQVKSYWRTPAALRVRGAVCVWVWEKNKAQQQKNKKNTTKENFGNINR